MRKTPPSPPRPASVNEAERLLQALEHVPRRHAAEGAGNLAQDAEPHLAGDAREVLELPGDDAEERVVQRARHLRADALHEAAHVLPEGAHRVRDAHEAGLDATAELRSSSLPKLGLFIGELLIASSWSEDQTHKLR